MSSDNEPKDRHGTSIAIGDILRATGSGETIWRYKVLKIDRLQGSQSAYIECLNNVEPGWEKRWVSRYDLCRYYEIKERGNHDNYPAV